uniref:Uncharacterized protein n=1 Tax=Myoviridae sp. ctLnO19 TaxID=2825085 RepID=A0A8S5P137_9CAUD|nr:MAG TPA: hypothetical protein [Myoviridae sp. ctLnO19]DAJ69099.1 MAG TPA: hypothetical protein [Caudoviricetes sp.]
MLKFAIIGCLAAKVRDCTIQYSNRFLTSSTSL